MSGCMRFRSAIQKETTVSKSIQIHHVIAALLLLIGLGACSEGGTIVGNAAVRGQVLADTSSPDAGRGLPGVEVRIAGKSVQTDDQGYWVANVDPAQIRALGLFKDGYAPASVAIDSGSRFIQSEFNPVQFSKEIDVTQDNAVVFDENDDGMPDATILIPKDSLGGNHENVMVNVSLVRPQVPGELTRFPGTYAARSEGAENATDLLRTFGTIDVSFTKDGELVDSSELNKPVTVQFALDTAGNPDIIDETSVIPTWWLDPETGIWHEEGTARIVEHNGVLVAQWQVRHFTWWNLDKPLDFHGCLALYVESDAEYPDLPRLEANLKGSDYNGVSSKHALKLNDYVVLTGWKGHSVSVRVLQNNIAQPELTEVFAPKSSEEGDVGEGTYLLPDTVGSGVLGQGPDGVPLDPETHCKVVRRNTKDLGLKQGVVHGHVFDANGNPLPGATVLIRSTGQTATTNREGFYNFPRVPWSPILDISLEVEVMNYHRAGKVLAFDPALVMRTQAEQNVDFTSTGFIDQPPVLVSESFSSKNPYVGETVAFSLKFRDDFGISAGDAMADDGDLSYTATPTGDGFEISGTWTAMATPGSAMLSFSVTDTGSHVLELSRQLGVTNPAPLVSISGPQYDVTVDEVAVYSVAISDPNGDPLTITIERDGETIFTDTMSATFPVYFDMPGAHALRATVDDGTNAVQLAYHVIVDAEPVDPPEFALTKLTERIAYNELEWAGIPSAEGYAIERAPGSEPTAFTQIASTNSLSLQDTSIGTTEYYLYRVRACVGDACQYSNTVTFTPVMFPLSPLEGATFGARTLYPQNVGLNNHQIIDDETFFFYYGDSVSQDYQLYLASFDQYDPTHIDFGDVDVVRDCQVSPMKTHVVCIGVKRSPLDVALYAVHVASRTAVRLSPVSTGNNLIEPEFDISSDDQYVAYTATQDTTDIFEVYSVPITGGMTTKLNDPVPMGRNIKAPTYWFGQYTAPTITPDNSRVLFAGDLEAANHDDLYSVPITGGTVTRISDAATTGWGVRKFNIHPDSNLVVYSEHTYAGSGTNLMQANVATGFIGAIEDHGMGSSEYVGFPHFVDPGGLGVLEVAYRVYPSVYEYHLSPLDTPAPVTIYPDPIAWNREWVSADRTRLLFTRDNAVSGRGLYELDVATQAVTKLSDLGTQADDFGDYYEPLITELDDLFFALKIDGGDDFKLFYLERDGLSPVNVGQNILGSMESVLFEYTAARYLDGGQVLAAFAGYDRESEDDHIYTAVLDGETVASVQEVSPLISPDFCFTYELIPSGDGNRLIVIGALDGQPDIPQVYSVRAR